MSGSAGRGSPSGQWSFSAPVWQWREGSWRFVTVPEDVSDEVDEAVGDATGGFGSVRVEVTLGATVWRTSIFPDDGAGTFVLPVKKAVRRAEQVDVGDTVRLRIALVDV